MSTDPQQLALGERLGRLENGQVEIGRRMAEMQAASERAQVANEKDHGEVLALLNRIDKAKVDRDEFEPVEKQNAATAQRVNIIFAIAGVMVVLIPLVFSVLQLVTGS